jgi:hypothetical protein
MVWHWWCKPEIPTLGRLRQEDGEFKDSLGYKTKPCLKKRNLWAFYQPEVPTASKRKQPWLI